MSLPPRMRAVVFDKPGSFGVTDVPTPRPARGEVLLRVHASMVCATDQMVFVLDTGVIQNTMKKLAAFK